MDVSNFTIAVTLNQNGRPVAFYLLKSTRQIRDSSSIGQKGVFAIVAALRKWKHLTGSQFVLITDQEAFSFNLNQKRKG